MPTFNVNQKTIFELLSDNRSLFLIPDYQRPYAWEDKVECSTLWDDVCSFAIPDNDPDSFDENNEYFLGPIVTFRNNEGKLEVIDGQQRLITLVLLLRAFYSAFGNRMRDNVSTGVKSRIGQCIWQTNMFQPNMNSRKIDSDVATYRDYGEFIEILKTGTAGNNFNSRYAKNYRFFQTEIEKLKQDSPNCFLPLAVRIMGNCIIFPIESNSQDTALRIFSTMNNRGKSLSDSDIFKAQLYKAFSNDGNKGEEVFINNWRKLENICGRIFSKNNDNPTDEIFTRYMYFERAKRGNKKSTLVALRKFYEDNDYELLRRYHKQTFSHIMALADFWRDVANQNMTRFSDRVLRRLFVLNYAPNSMWTYITSVYFLQNRDSEGRLDDEKFYTFLSRIIAFTLAYTLIGNGVAQFRTPIFSEMVNIIDGKEVTFRKFMPSEEGIVDAFNKYTFSNNRPMTKAMLAWYAFNDKSQELIQPLETPFEIEHIYANSIIPHMASINEIGNKSLLEPPINKIVANFRFPDKARYYIGEVEIAGKPIKTQIHDLHKLAHTLKDFTEQDIARRTQRIINDFIQFIADNEPASV
ncbi:MAG: DUF262 domain-containing protein [Synergistaceae bacterium]|nr:DUF262 domain-containing protein [Synergistaceae bacterium]